MKNIYQIAILILLASSCGTDDSSEPMPRVKTCDLSCENAKKIEALEAQVLQLAGNQSQLQSLVNSDFASCPLSGDTANVLVNKICKVAQASTVESQTALKEQLAAYIGVVKSQIDTVNTDLLTAQATEAADFASLSSQIASINTQLATITTSITALTTRVTSAESAITALQTMTSSINTTLNGTMVSLDIGTENVAAGPLYETVLRRVDKTRINAYVEATAAAKTISSNGLNATNGSNALIVTATAHGLAAGDTILLSGLVGSRGFTSADLGGYAVVSSVADANTFTFLARRNAVSGGTLGGAAGTVKKVQGYGLASIWTTANGADVAVRQTTLGAQIYNFIIKANGDICYDTAVAAQIFATISAGGGTVVCK